MICVTIMNNLNPKTTDPLVSIAINKLSNIDPSAWDTDAMDIWKSSARNAGMLEGRSDADQAACWSAAIRSMAVIDQKKHKKYLKIRKELEEAPAVEPCDVDWPNMCVGGQSDGVSYRLMLFVDGKRIDITLSSTQLEDPSFVLSRIRHATGKFNITNPYRDKKEAWGNSVLATWWTRLQREEHQDETSVTEESIRRFCQMKVTNSADTARAFDQTSKAILEEGYIYVAWEGLVKFVKRDVGDMLASKTLTSALLSLGFSKTKRGSKNDQKRFWFIERQVLFKDYDIDSGEAGIGEESGDREQGTAMDDGLDVDILLEAERTRLAGQGSGTNAVNEEEGAAEAGEDASFIPF